MSKEQLQRSDQPFVLSKGELSKKFRILKPEEVEKLGLTKTKPKSPERKRENGISIEQAKEILGEDVLGPEAIEATFGVELTPNELQEIENIPFTREELEQAKQLGMMLVLRVPRLGEGKTERPLTIESARELFAKGDTLGDPKKKKQQVFYGKKGKVWYDNEKFVTQDTPKLGWGLVMKSVLPDSLSKNWDQQEEVLKKWAKENNIDPNLIKRRTPVEIAYDTLIYYGENKESLLENRYDWTGVQSSDGSFVDVGRFGSDGLGFGGVSRDSSRPDLGVCPSR